VNEPSFGTDLGDPTQDEWLAGVFKTSDFTVPPPGTLGNLPRNAYTGPSYFNSDLSLLKNVRIPWFGGQRTTFQIRFEAFNLFNEVNLNNPATSLQSSLFGKVTSTRPMRVVQLGAKFLF
jgi:hypothetical protein